MTLYRLYRLRRRAGLSRRLSLRLAFESLKRDREFERQRAEALRRDPGLSAVHARLRAAELARRPAVQPLVAGVVTGDRSAHARRLLRDHRCDLRGWHRQAGPRA